MAFIENMEGTADSLEKFRRNPTLTTSSPMMPLPAAYNQSNSSIVLQDEENVPKVRIFKICIYSWDNKFKIFQPARYKKPSHEELESSKTLSAKRARELELRLGGDQSLPGTPEDKE